MIVGKGMVDEVFVLQTFGIQIDIVALIDEINNKNEEYAICECLTEELLSINRTDNINTEIVNNMNDARFNQPIIVTAINDSLWVIDGNHRLFKRYKLGKKMTYYIFINRIQLEPFVSEFL